MKKENLQRELGFGIKNESGIQRALNKDGLFNVRRTGVDLIE